MIARYLLPLLLLSGCFSTGVVPMGQNHYSISKTSPACGFRDAGGVRADVYKEMNAYCTSKSLYPEVLTIEALDGVLGRRCASATVEFRCVTQATANLTPSGKRPDRDMNRDPRTAADRGQFGAKTGDPIVVKQEVVHKTGDVYGDLQKLKELLDAGIITQEEFNARKQIVLAQ